MARTKEVCFRCLETGHMAKGCREGRPCGVDGCRQLHHKLLHPSPTTESARSSGSDSIHPSLWAVRSTSGKGLQTARACAYGPNGKHVVVNCLLDTGTAVSFIRKDVAKILGLTGPHERCRFTALGGRVGPECRWRRVEFRFGAVGSSSRPDASTMVKALAIPRVCGKVQPGPAESSDGTPARTLPERGRRQETPHMVDVLVGIDYYSKSDRWVSGRGDPPWVDYVRESRPKTIHQGQSLVERRRFRRQPSAERRPETAADGTVASKRLELEGSYGNLRVGKVGGCAERERRLWRVDVRRGAVGSSGQPVTSRRMGAFAIQRIREKIRQEEMDISDKSHEAAVTKMKRRQWLPIGVDVRIEIDYYFGFVTGRMRRRATGGPVALEALFGWVARGRASPRWTAEVGTFLVNSGKSADVSWQKTGRIEAVKIVPEGDVPEGKKEALEKREEISTSGVKKSQVSLPRCSGQRGLSNVVKRTSRQLAVERGLKKWVTGNLLRQGPGWPAEPLQARQRSPEGSGRTTRLSQVGESPPGQSELALTMDDADAADPRPSTIKGNAAGVWQTSVHRQRSVSRHQSAKGKHGDAERTEGELHWTEVTRKPLVKEVNTDTPVSTGHPAGSSREARVDRDPNLPQALGNTAHRGTSIVKRDRATQLDTNGVQEAQGSRWRAAEAQKAQLAELPSRNERPLYAKTPPSGEGLVLPSAVDGHMVASLESKASPRHAATALEAKQQRRRTMDDCSDVESQGGSSASASRPRNSSDTIHRPGRRNNTDPVGVTWPRGGTRKSRVGKNNTRAPPARSLSEHLAAPSRGQKGLLLRPDLSAFARQLRARHKGGSGQTKGHGSGHHDGIIKGLTKDQRIRTITTTTPPSRRPVPPPRRSGCATHPALPTIGSAGP
ncbi:hypothetical protein T03_4079 [Trichinella britovi]|uniref:CCHC-type domain-containing protein n=1 Tax=Trichinella britovi TaxID=45882 RepID=A0A0V1C5C3_TRIBR|nr:hypothetical protein T03_4079 [Trichinella britovi]